MKRSVFSLVLVLLTALLGFAGWWVLGNILNSLDSRGLIVPGTQQQLVLWALTAVAALIAGVGAWKCRLGEAGRTSGLACLVLAAGIVSLKDMTLTAPQLLLLAHKGAAILSLLALVIMGALYLLGKKPPYFLQLIVCIFGILQLIVCYQLWNERPQFLLYFFGAGAVLALMVFLYGLTERASELPCKRVTVLAGLLGVFFAAVAASQGECPLFFTAAAVFEVLELTALNTEA